MGQGLASRFSIALSRVTDPAALEGVQNLDEDIGEIVTLLMELNNHQDLTVKLNNQSKICNIFKKGHRTNFMSNKKLELDPQIATIMEKCKSQLELLQTQKEEAIDKFLEAHTEDRLITIKQLEKQKKASDPNFAEALEQEKTKWNQLKQEGLQQIKVKYNEMCQQVNVDTNAIVALLTMKRLGKVSDCKDKLN